MSETRIGLLLASLPELQHLNRELKKLAALQDALRKVLPSDLAKCTTVASVTAGTVILYAANNPVAAKLKQLTPRILIQFREQHPEITALLVHMQVAAQSPSVAEKQISIGPGARSALENLADRLQCSPLRSALRRLRQR